MTSTYDARGRRVGATVVEIQPNVVTQIKEKNGLDGYSAVQLGLGTKKSVKKPQIGHVKKAGVEQKIRWFREVRTDEGGKLSEGSLGKEINVKEVFSVGDAVKVTGTSKGKGFQGGVRRHGFHGGPKTHGQSDRHRAPGSIGAGTTPGRVLKGKKMAGHMGVETVTTRGLEVISIDKANNLMVIKGAVPGHVGGLVRIEKLGRIKGYIPPPEEKEDKEEEEASKENKQSLPSADAERQEVNTENTEAVKEEQANAQS